MSPTSIVLSIVLAIGTLGGLAFWDEEREARSAMDDFAHEQVTVARGVAAALEVRAAPQLEPIVLDVIALRAAFSPVSQPETIALLQLPRHEDLLASTGKRFPSTALGPPADDECWLDGRDDEPPDASPSTANDASGCWSTLSRAQASALGLPERRAVLGISGFHDKDGALWKVAVAASAHRERDRERRAVWRLILGLLLSSGSVIAFGTLALRQQKRELALARELAVREAVRARDERLVRADKLATMGALAIGIAHEVSTPLGVIVGRAEQLAPRVKEDLRAQRAVSVIAEQADRIGRVVRGLLSLARGGTPSLAQVAPAALARTAADLVAHRFDAAGVALRVDADGGLPHVSCDAGLFEQALVNLLLNACDACAKGGKVDVTVRRPGPRVVFTVVDDGEGIGTQAALRATEPFFTTKPEGKGTGLGLAITNEIVHHHHGKLSIGPREGVRGTEARIELPVPDVAPTA